MRTFKIVILGIIMTTSYASSTINIKTIETHHTAPLIEMILQCAYDLWPINTTFELFRQKHLDTHEFKDISNFQSEYLDNNGIFKVLLDGEKIVGAGAIRKIDNEICELKRMWFVPEYRGKGLGKMVADQLLTFAKEQGYKKIRLDVYYPEYQQAAVALYKKLGFYEIPAYNNSTAQLFMEKELASNTIEIELRYEVLKPEQLASFVASLQKIHSKHDVDIYFDNPTDYLHKNGIYIRTRNNKKLDIKFNRACLNNPNLAIQDYCEEHSFALPLQETDLHKINDLLISLNLKPMSMAHLENLKSVNQFKEQCTVDKMRTSYQYDNFTICVDEVKDLGTFLEIELMADTAENVAKVKQEMLTLIHGLELKPIKTGYINLLLRKKDFAHYLLGRFILEEDRI